MQLEHSCNTINGNRLKLDQTAVFFETDFKWLLALMPRLSKVSILRRMTLLYSNPNSSIERTLYDKVFRVQITAVHVINVNLSSINQ